MSEKITIHQILTKINEARNLACREPRKTAEQTLATVIKVDHILLDLQEQILDDYGNESQTRGPNAK